MDDELLEEDEVYFVEEDERLDEDAVDLEGGNEDDYYEDGFGEEGNYSDD